MIPVIERFSFSMGIEQLIPLSSSLPKNLRVHENPATRHDNLPLLLSLACFRKNPRLIEVTTQRESQVNR
jgi:hypothetical protein